MVIQFQNHISTKRVPNGQTVCGLSSYIEFHLICIKREPYQCFFLRKEPYQGHLSCKKIELLPTGTHMEEEALQFFMCVKCLNICEPKTFGGKARFTVLLQDGTLIGERS